MSTMSALRWSSSYPSRVFFFSLALLIALSSAFPDGAPGETCVRHKPNHGGKAQPLANMPFQVTASSSTYQPGETVAGRYQFTKHSLVVVIISIPSQKGAYLSLSNILFIHFQAMHKSLEQRLSLILRSGAKVPFRTNKCLQV
jgi:hypothetical protein